MPNIATRCASRFGTPPRKAHGKLGFAPDLRRLEPLAHLQSGKRPHTLVHQRSLPSSAHGTEGQRMMCSHSALPTRFSATGEKPVLPDGNNPEHRPLSEPDNYKHKLE